MPLSALKRLLPNHAVATRILRGPFRGARPVMNPRHSLRKIFGLYEHELNGWLEQALRRVSRVIDVGANDGYFAFGSAAAFRRLDKQAEIVAIESQDQHMRNLQGALRRNEPPGVRLRLVQAYAGRELKPGFVTLDSLPVTGERTSTLVKIDVEGAELDVVEGAHSWMHPSNLFVIEVHEESFLERLTAIFADRGHRLVRIDQRPLPFFGREVRAVQNWWLVSKLRP